jgi:hypothetical protein
MRIYIFFFIFLFIMDIIDKIFCFSTNDIKKENIKKCFSVHNIDITFINYDENDDLIKNPNYYIKSSSISKLSKQNFTHFVNHINCIKNIANQESSTKLFGILEDDVKLIDDFKNKLTKHLEKSKEIFNKITSAPIILFMSGIKNTKPTDTGKFVNLPYHFSSGFYLINKLMANLIIDNYLPIHDSYDVFLGEFLKKNNIKTFYYSVPILSYSLSSSLYSSYFNNDDRKTLDIYKKTIDKTIIQQNCEFTFQNTISNFDFLMRNLIITNCNNPNSKNNFPINKVETLNILFGGDVNNINSNSLVFGGGIRNITDTIIKPQKIFFVRGPITREQLKSKNIFAPEIYGDPTLLLPLFYSPPIDTKFKIGLVVDSYSAKQMMLVLREMKNKKKIYTINLDNQSLTSSIEDIIASKFIITPSVYGLMLAHAYNKKVILLKSKHYSINIEDYLHSIGIDKSPIFKFKDKLIDNIEKISDETHYPNIDIIKKLQNNVIDNTYFIDLKNNIKKIDYVSENKTIPKNPITKPLTK